MNVPPESAEPPRSRSSALSPSSAGGSSDRIPSPRPPLQPARLGPHAQFFTGAWALVRGARFLWRTPATWLPAAVPVALCAVLCSVAIGLSIHFVPILMARAWPDLAGHIGRFGATLVRWIGVVAASVFGMSLASFVTPPLSAPALERLLLLRERDLGVTPRAAAGFWRELVCALQAQLLAVAIVGPVLAALWATTFLLPAAAVATVPLKFLALAWLLAWTLLDYPMSLRGVRLRRRLRLLVRGTPVVLGFGSALAVIFAIPFMPLLMLPVAVTAAAEISVLLEQNEPTL